MHEEYVSSEEFLLDADEEDTELTDEEEEADEDPLSAEDEEL